MTSLPAGGTATGNALDTLPASMTSFPALNTQALAGDDRRHVGHHGDRGGDARSMTSLPATIGTAGGTAAGKALDTLPGR